MTKPQTTENIDQFVSRRTKEILCEGGYDWHQFSTQEKMIAAIQAEREYSELAISKSLAVRGLL